MQVLGYVRVSTDEQGDSGAGLEAQRKTIETACTARGWTLVCIEQDVASGAATNRPGLGRALDAVAQGDADGLIVAKLDRLSRDVEEAAALVKRFRTKRWTLVVLDLDIDTSTIMGEGMAMVAATFAQMERRRISERTREALAVKRAQGVQLGRPRTLPESVRRQIVRARRRGDTYSRIAERLNERGVPTAQGGAQWYASTVRKVAMTCG